MSDVALNEALRNGKAAHLRGMTRANNPFADLSDEALEWFEGWATRNATTSKQPNAVGVEPVVEIAITALSSCDERSCLCVRLRGAGEGAGERFALSDLTGIWDRSN